MFDSYVVLGTDFDLVLGFNDSETPSKIDVSGLIAAFSPSSHNISDLVLFVEITNDNPNMVERGSVLQVDIDGTGNATGFQNVSLFNHVYGMDATTLYESGQLIA